MSDKTIGLEADVKRSPLLGEHNDEILSDILNYDDEKINKIKQSEAMK